MTSGQDDRARRIAGAVREQFGRQAAHYVQSVAHARGDTLAMTVDLAAPSPGERAADVATGTGHTALALAPRLGGATVLAIDFTRPMLEAARRLAQERGLPQVRCILGDAQALPVASGSLDLVTCRVAPHHFADPAAFVVEAARVLRKGGRLVVCDTASPGDPAADTSMHAVELARDPSHVRNYTAAEWRGFVARAGLVLEHIELGQWTHLGFDDWVQRGGTDAATVASLRHAFETAPPAARAAFGIEPDPAVGFRFSWTVALFRARKP